MRLVERSDPIAGTTYFNSRTHKGCDNNNLNKHLDDEDISIHAPIKDATIIRPILVCSSSISIHAPIKDATEKAKNKGDNQNISIHAPIKDATSCTLSVFTLPVYFNSRTHKGCDQSPRFHSFLFANFNSRTHKGCDMNGACRDVIPKISIHAPIKDATLSSNNFAP